MQEPAVGLTFEFCAADDHFIDFGHQMEPLTIRHGSQALFDLLLHFFQGVARKAIDLQVNGVLSTHRANDD